MALGTNPNFSQVRAFFGGSANFKDYYRGGPYVPNIPANNAISTTSAGLRLSQFSGADKELPPVGFTWSVSPTFFRVNNSTAWTTQPFVISTNGATGPVTYSISLFPQSGMLANVSAGNGTANPTIQARRQGVEVSGEDSYILFSVTHQGVTTSGRVDMYFG